MPKMMNQEVFLQVIPTEDHRGILLARLKVLINLDRWLLYLLKFVKKLSNMKLTAYLCGV